MKPVAFLFDFDGVIADSISMHLLAWDQACQALFGKMPTPERRKSIIGLSTKEIAILLSTEMCAPERRDDLASLKRQRLSENRDKVPLLPGAREAIAHLTASKVPFGIASNAPVLFIQQVLAGEGISVQTIIGIENSGRPKPFPDPFLTCAKLLGIRFTQHHEVVVFEDSTHGLKAAKDAGMIPIGIRTQHQDQYLRSHGARLTCDSLKEALDSGWFENLPL